MARLRPAEIIPYCEACRTRFRVKCKCPPREDPGVVVWEIDATDQDPK